MADAFIVRRGGGGGGAGATLEITGVVTSPASTVTITNTALGKTFSKTLDAQGKATFKGLASGTWDIAMTDGTKTATSSINIVIDYAKSLRYELILFANGAASPESGGFTNSNIVDNQLDVIPTPGAWKYCNSNNMIDVTNFSTLSVAVWKTYPTDGSGYCATHFGLTSSKGVTNINNFLARKEVTAGLAEKNTYELDISSVTGNVYFQLSARGAYDANNPNHITSIILS